MNLRRPLCLLFVAIASLTFSSCQTNAKERASVAKALAGGSEQPADAPRGTSPGGF